MHFSVFRKSCKLAVNRLCYEHDYDINTALMKEKAQCFVIPGNKIGKYYGKHHFRKQCQRTPGCQMHQKLADKFKDTVSIGSRIKTGRPGASDERDFLRLTELHINVNKNFLGMY